MKDNPDLELGNPERVREIVEADPEKYAKVFKGLLPEGTEVITDGDRLTAVWLDAHSLVNPVPDQPVVDFDTEIVVLASMGTRPTGGYSIEVASAAETVSGVVVTIVERSPGPTCLVSQAITNPTTLVQVPAAGREVELIVERR